MVRQPGMASVMGNMDPGTNALACPEWELELYQELKIRFGACTKNPCEAAPVEGDAPVETGPMEEAMPAETAATSGGGKRGRRASAAGATQAMSGEEIQGEMR